MLDGQRQEPEAPVQLSCLYVTSVTAQHGRMRRGDKVEDSASCPPAGAIECKSGARVSGVQGLGYMGLFCSKVMYRDGPYESLKRRTPSKPGTYLMDI